MEGGGVNVGFEGSGRRRLVGRGMYLYPVSEFGRGGISMEKEWGLGLESKISKLFRNHSIGGRRVGILWVDESTNGRRRRKMKKVRQPVTGREGWPASG